MRKERRKLLLFGLVAVALIGGLSWLICHEREPVYQGKRLSKWLALYTRGVDINSQGLIIVSGDYATRAASIQADEVVRQIGTNAIPTLLRLLENRESPLKLKWIALLQKQHYFKPPQRAWLGYSQAGQAFDALGPAASNAVPALVRLYWRRISVPSQVSILGALGEIGPNPAPAEMSVFLDGMTNSNPPLRSEALFEIGQIHAPPEVFVPLLIKALNDPQPFVRRAAARSLAGYGAEAKSAVPVLIPLLDDPSAIVRSEAAHALEAIDPEAAAEAGVK
jgi:HEAT repeats